MTGACVLGTGSLGRRALQAGRLTPSALSGLSFPSLAYSESRWFPLAWSQSDSWDSAPLSSALVRGLGCSWPSEWEDSPRPHQPRYPLLLKRPLGHVGSPTLSLGPAKAVPSGVWMLWLCSLEICARSMVPL